MFARPQINLYVADVERSVDFYRRHLEFAETFRTPRDGAPVHVELGLDGFTLGVASHEAARGHGVRSGDGPGGELVLWADDVDTAYAELVAAGVTSVAAPHDFGDGGLRAAWVADPDGHPVQLVTRGAV